MRITGQLINCTVANIIKKVDIKQTRNVIIIELTSDEFAEVWYIFHVYLFCMELF
jgi:hypothetical protein